MRLHTPTGRRLYAIVLHAFVAHKARIVVPGADQEASKCEADRKAETCKARHVRIRHRDDDAQREAEVCARGEEASENGEEHHLTKVRLCLRAGPDAT